MPIRSVIHRAAFALAVGITGILSAAPSFADPPPVVPTTPPPEAEAQPPAAGPTLPAPPSAPVPSPARPVIPPPPRLPEPEVRVRLIAQSALGL